MTRDVAELDIKPLEISCLSDNPKDCPSVEQVSAKIQNAKSACSEKVVVVN